MGCYLPVCQIYCIHTYELAMKYTHSTGIKNKHTKSDEIAIQTKKMVNACKTDNERKSPVRSIFMIGVLAGMKCDIKPSFATY